MFVMVRGCVGGLCAALVGSVKHDYASGCFGKVVWWPWDDWLSMFVNNHVCTIAWLAWNVWFGMVVLADVCDGACLCWRVVLCVGRFC